MSENAPTSAAEPAAFRTSPQIDQVAAALVEAQGMMFSPTRNKRVLYEKRRGGIVDFRYSTLDVVNDMIRLPNHVNGLAIMHVTQQTRFGPFVITRLLHRSGQWMENATPLIQDEAGPQAYSSAQTLAMRYGICALMNIAAETDDDGNEAAGNTVRKLQPDLVERELKEKLNRLVHQANLAKQPLDVTNVLKGWQSEQHEWMAFAEQADRADQWELLTRLVPNAIRRVFGDEMATAWASATFAKNTADMATLRARWDGEWKAARQTMKTSALDAYGLLWEHLRMQAARVEREADEAARRAAAAAAAPVLAAPEPPPPVPVEAEPSPWTAGGPVDIAPPAAAPILAAPCEAGREVAPRAERLPDVVGFLVLDDAGEPASDAVTEPILYARLYAGQHHGSDDQRALATLNARGLEWASQNQEAALVLTNEVGFWVLEGIEPPAPLPPPPEPAASAAQPVPAAEPEDVELPLPSPAPRAPRRTDLVVPVPKTHRGTLDLRRYLLMVKVSLQRLEDRDLLPHWIEANSQAYETMPNSTRLQVLAHVVACERGFGVEPTWSPAAELVA